jgi:hypothetical protein
MRRIAGALVSMIGVVACTTGDDANSKNPNPQGRVCGATMTVSGNFVADPSAPAPTGYAGCWPAGMWTFSAAVAMNDCSSQPMLAQSYAFQGIEEFSCTLDPMQRCSVDADCAPTSSGTCDPTQPIVDKFKLVTPDPTSIRSIVKVSELGNAMCEGEVDLYSNDGTQVWEFRPDLQQMVSGNLTGQGEFTIFTTDQYPTGN